MAPQRGEDVSRPRRAYSRDGTLESSVHQVGAATAREQDAIFIKDLSVRHADTGAGLDDPAPCAEVSRRRGAMVVDPQVRRGSHHQAGGEERIKA